MSILQHPSNPVKSRSRPHHWPFLRCCPFADHLSLLAELEYASTDPDVSRVLPRARVLMAGRTDKPAVVPWWIR